MLEQAEAQVKLSLDDVALKRGLDESNSKFDSWKDKVMSSLHPIHHSLREMRMVLHGLGAVAVLSTFEHIIHLAEKLKPLLDGDREAFEKMIDEANKKLVVLSDSLQGLRRKLEDLRNVRLTDGGEKDEAQSSVMRRLKRDVAEARGGVSFADSAVENAKAEQAKFGHSAESQAKLADAQVIAAEKQKKLTEAQVALEEYKNHLFEERKAQIKAQDDEVEKDAEKEQHDKEEREHQLHRLKMYHLEQEKIKRGEALTIKGIKDDENKIFQPSTDQILQSGYWKHGKFRSSWASQQEQDILDQTKAIQEDIPFGMNDNIRQRMENVNSMKSDLNKFLGVTGTPEERIAKATESAETHLKDIRAAFYEEK